MAYDENTKRFNPRPRSFFPSPYFITPSFPRSRKLAEGRGFEPPVGLRLRLISSQVPLTTQPPFHQCIPFCLNPSPSQADSAIEYPALRVDRQKSIGLHAGALRRQQLK